MGSAVPSDSSNPPEEESSDGRRAQAIVAASRNGAIASRGLDQFGTIEAGKRADLLLIEANPLDDIHNIRKVTTILRDGRVIDRDKLPERRVLSRAPAAKSETAAARPQ